jgi:hypothetical protein
MMSREQSKETKSSVGDRLFENATALQAKKVSERDGGTAFFSSQDKAPALGKWTASR